MTLSPPLAIRSAAAAAALVLAVLSRGDAAVLALVLVVAAGRPWAVVAVGPALAAVAWRWGATSLEALAGYQSVLGPAGWTGSGPRVASAWLAAAALVLSTPRLSGPGRTLPTAPAGARGPDGRLRAAAPAALVVGASRWAVVAGNLVGAGGFGAAAAVVVAGPGPGEDVWVRVVATLVGVALALGAVALRGRWERWVDGGAAVAGVVALALVASADPPSFADAFDARAAARGLGIAAAVAAAVGVSDQVWRARSGRRPA